MVMLPLDENTKKIPMIDAVAVSEDVLSRFASESKAVVFSKATIELTTDTFIN